MKVLVTPMKYPMKVFVVSYIFLNAYMVTLRWEDESPFSQGDSEGLSGLLSASVVLGRLELYT